MGTVSKTPVVHILTVNNSNSALNVTRGDNLTEALIPATTENILIGLVLSVIILAILLGNGLVLLSVTIFPRMRTSSHGLITSLATADFLVGVVVLPLSAYMELSRGVWRLGPVLCDVWMTGDVCFCTASILNVCAIAIDRYLKITQDANYARGSWFTRKRTCILMVVSAWCVALGVASAPLFGWRTGLEKQGPTFCLISQDTGYTFFSTFGAFYLPVIIIIIIYARIYSVAILRLKVREREKSKRRKESLRQSSLRQASTRESSLRHDSTRESNSDNLPSTHVVEYACGPLNNNRDSGNTRMIVVKPKVQNRRESNTMRGVNKATRMLGAIIGCFVACWLPFFILAVLLPLCSSCAVPPVVNSIALWLGYTNSLINPVIYAIWNNEFQNAFRRILTCRMTGNRF